MNLSPEEIILIERHRAEKEEEQQDILFEKMIYKVLWEWHQFSDQTGAGLTFSTFTSESEFNVSQFLDDKFDKRRPRIFELIRSIRELIQIEINQK